MLFHSFTRYAVFRGRYRPLHTALKLNYDFCNQLFSKIYCQQNNNAAYRYPRQGFLCFLPALITANSHAQSANDKRCRNSYPCCGLQPAKDVLSGCNEILQLYLPPFLSFCDRTYRIAMTSKTIMIRPPTTPATMIAVV